MSPALRKDMVRVIKDADPHPIEVTTVPNDTKQIAETIFRLINGHMPGSGEDCVVIVTGEFESKKVGIAELDDKDDSHVVLGIEDSVASDSGAVRSLAQATIAKFEQDGLLPLGLSRRETHLTIDADSDNLEQVQQGIAGLSVPGLVTVEAVGPPEFSQAA